MPLAPKGFAIMYPSIDPEYDEAWAIEGANGGDEPVWFMRGNYRISRTIYSSHEDYIKALNTELQEMIYPEG